MASRLVQVFVPDVASDKVDAVLAALEGEAMVAVKQNLPGPLMQFHILVPAERLESLLDPLQTALGSFDSFRAVVLPVETVIPKLQEAANEETAEAPAKVSPRNIRISREELVEDLTSVTQPAAVHWWMVGLSTVVATIGLATDSTAVLIGAMVIAPLLGPNMALALATTLGDGPLARLSIRANLVGVVLAFLVAGTAAILFDLPVDTPQVLARTDLHPEDLLLAMAAGGAGALAFTSGVAASLVGVMVAVALLPPLAVCAMTAAAGDWDSARGAAMLLGGNLVGVNFAAIATFLLSGVAPRTWWQKKRSRKVTYGMLGLWAALLLALAFFAWKARAGGS